eukprot:TRINITY_DN5897_c0_g1_i1.p1 TRINITY_DN5897_c0_g1~~TRINITY_DN5897_c0_g1_i1.p1  ORF type:complete len:101 (-),score=11.46 TRINITY_DN5897_c0_g1_i1:57-359(-)
MTEVAGPLWFASYNPIPVDHSYCNHRGMKRKAVTPLVEYIPVNKRAHVVAEVHASRAPLHMEETEESDQQFQSGNHYAHVNSMLRMLNTERVSRLVNNNN